METIACPRCGEESFTERTLVETRWRKVTPHVRFFTGGGKAAQGTAEEVCEAPESSEYYLCEWCGEVYVMEHDQFLPAWL